MGLARRTSGRWLRGSRVLTAEHAGFVRERALRHKLLPLQFLDALLQLGNLGFVDFEGRRRGSCGRRGPRGLRLFATR